MAKNYKKLLSIFKALGAKDPEGRARSEAEEDIPQMARYLFLRQAWKNCVINEDDPSWTGLKAQPLGKGPSPDEPCGGFGAALNRLLLKGVDPKDLIEVIRVQQYESLFALCYLLSDPGDVEPEAADVAWGLFEVDEERRPGRDLGCLHEDLLSMDPTGREMRPQPGTP